MSLRSNTMQLGWLAFKLNRVQARCRVARKCVIKNSRVVEGSRAVQEKQLPEPDTCQISTQKAKELDSARTKEKHHPKQRVKEKSRRNIPLARLYQPSLTLWFLSFIASIIWLCVFYVERQPIQHREEERLDRVRFAEMTELLPEPGKSRQ